MTCKVNCDTSDGLKLVSDTSGALDIQSAGVTKISMDSSGNVSIGGNDVLTDAAKTLSQNGYQKFSNGYTIQWGKHTSSSSSFTVTYPVAFTTVYSIAVTPFDT